MNRDEAAALLGAAAEHGAMAEGLRRRGASAAIVTAGAEGAALADADGLLRLPARRLPWRM